MFKFNKKNLLNLERLKKTPLLLSSDKGENIFRIKKIKSFFNVNYNKSVSSCNPCMDACKKVNNKINGRKLSNVSNNEMKELIKVFSS